MLEFDLNAARRRLIAWIDVDGNCFSPKVSIGEESGSGPSSPRKQEVDEVAKGSNAAGPSEAHSEARANADGNGSDDGRINDGKKIVGSVDRLNPGEEFVIAVCLPDSDRKGGAAVGGGSLNVEPANENGVTAPGNGDGGTVGPTLPGEVEYSSFRIWGVERLTSVKRRARMGPAAPRAADPSPVNRQVRREVMAPRKARGKCVNRRASKGKKVAAIPAARGLKVNTAGDANFVNTGRRNAADCGKQPLEVDPSKKDGGDGGIGRWKRAHLVIAPEYSPTGERWVPEWGPLGEKRVPECGLWGEEWAMVPTPGKPALDSMAGKLVKLSVLKQSLSTTEPWSWNSTRATLLSRICSGQA